MSQEELAEKLHLESRVSISMYERNQRGVSNELLVCIADVLDSTTDYILYGEGGEPFIREVATLASQIKSEAMKRMVRKQLRDAIALEEELLS